jgi:hypothetical protein
VTHADTQGGTELTMVGQNLWDDVAFVTVSVTTPAGPVVISACAFDVPHERLACTLPPGSGSISLITVAVLAQSATLSPVGLAYAAPMLIAALPSAWPTNVDGATLTITGRGFGHSSQSSLVAVTVRGAACGAANTTLRVQTITVRSDTEATFQVQGAPDHLVPQWFVDISVAGQAATTGTWSVPTRPPTVPTLSFARVFNGTHYFVLLTGSEYGPGVGTPGGACVGDVTVTIDFSPCDVLTMPQVRGNWMLHCALWDVRSSGGALTLTSTGHPLLKCVRACH